MPQSVSAVQADSEHMLHVRLFSCAMCPSKFDRKCALREQIACHVKEKTFSCPHCEFRTHVKLRLSNQITKMHKTLETFNCSFPGCNFSSTYLPSVRQHFRRTHSNHPDPILRRPFACTFPDCTYTGQANRTVLNLSPVLAIIPSMNLSTNVASVKSNLTPRGASVTT